MVIWGGWLEEYGWIVESWKMVARRMVEMRMVEIIWLDVEALKIGRNLKEFGGNRKKLEDGWEEKDWNIWLYVKAWKTGWRFYEDVGWKDTDEVSSLEVWSIRIVGRIWLDVESWKMYDEEDRLGGRVATEKVHEVNVSWMFGLKWWFEMVVRRGPEEGRGCWRGAWKRKRIHVSKFCWFSSFLSITHNHQILQPYRAEVERALLLGLDRTTE
jgi:hypothetical protein